MARPHGLSPLVGWARSSAGEHYVDIVGVTGSIPVAPTIRPSEKIETFAAELDGCEVPVRFSEPRIHTGDALAVMREMAAGSVDAVICDPPYGTTRCPWDAVIPLPEMWAELTRICRPGAPMVFTACMPFTAALVMSNPKRFRHHWIWEKNKATGHLNAKRAPMRAHEDVLVFCDQAPPYAPQMTEGHKPGNYARRVQFTPVYGAQVPTEYGGSTLRYPRTVQRFDIINNDDPTKIHPTQKPVDLMAYLVRTYTLPGQVVLDFACGSGTTGEACLREGRQFIGIESDEDFAAAARARLAMMASECEAA